MLLKLCFWFLFASAYAEATEELDLYGAKPDCLTKCGSLTIPYPFGIGIECALSKELCITCNDTNILSIPFIQSSNIEILDISATEVRIKNHMAYGCFNESESISQASDPVRLSSVYTLSDKKNIFVSVGCNTIAFIQGSDAVHYTSGCVTMCHTKESILNGLCSGIACCQTFIPRGVKYYQVYVQQSNLTSGFFGFRTCSYALLAENNKFEFDISDLDPDRSFYYRMRDTPVVLDWVVENITCQDARRNKTGFACQENTVCVDSDNGPGYRCSCKKGYEGNPYMTPGCQDINECEDSSKNLCAYGANCINLPGTYNCSCMEGTYGDGRKGSIGCNPKRKGFPVIQVTVGIILGHLLLLFTSYWLYFGLKKRRVIQLRKKFLKQNHRLLLREHQMSFHKGGAVNISRIYKAAELKLATNNYDESRIIGKGGNGTVYKGIFTRDQTETVVAIKKSKLVDRTQIEQFINEVVIITQINHRHIVRLLGCCLETEVPLLVYEFIPNNTLYDHIHNRRVATGAPTFSWQRRLRIATETAGALAYLHSTASVPIIHRDVKSANILLDDNFTTKVADFGASKFIPLDQTHISTLVQGTLGYLDPQYFQTCALTEKSDVYSFGVILVELLTGEKAVSVMRLEGRRNLAIHFILSMQENALLQIVENHMMDEGNTEQLFAVAELALRCLKLEGKERPTMREVAEELEGIRRLSERYQPSGENEEETQYLLDIPSDPLSLNPSSGVSGGNYSMSSMLSSLGLPR